MYTYSFDNTKNIRMVLMGSIFKSYLLHLSAQAQKRKKICSKKGPYFSLKKFFLYFKKWNFLIFSQKNIFLYFGKWNFLASSLKNSYIFRVKKFLYFRRELGKVEKQTFLIFLWRKFSSPFQMTADEATKPKTNCKKSSFFLVFYVCFRDYFSQSV